MRCRSCSYAYVLEPRTDFAELYDEAYYEGRGADALVDYATEMDDPRTVRVYEWQGITEVVRGLAALSPSTRWLDYGAGLGGLVRYTPRHRRLRELRIRRGVRRRADDRARDTVVESRRAGCIARLVRRRDRDRSDRARARSDRPLAPRVPCLGARRAGVSDDRQRGAAPARPHALVVRQGSRRARRLLRARDARSGPRNGGVRGAVAGFGPRVVRRDSVQGVEDGSACTAPTPSSGSSRGGPSARLWTGATASDAMPAGRRPR